MPLAPQSIRTQSSRQYLFMLSESACSKASLRTLMKLTPGVELVAIDGGRPLRLKK